MSLSSGDRDRRITFLRAAYVRNDHNEKVPTWGAVGDRWAQVIFGAGSERREAAQNSADAPATFRVLHDGLTAAVTTTDRIRFEGSDWDIKSNVPLGRPNEGREITAIRKV